MPRHPDQLSDEELDSWVQKLVNDRHPEGPTLDYKQELDIGKKSGKIEFVKDITSFANELGGTLIYGVPEERSSKQEAPIPSSTYGMDPQPGLIETLENLLSDAISPLLPEYRLRSFPVSKFPGKNCYIVWTPESWFGPHMVSGYEDNRYYRRGQYRTVRMSERDVEERYQRRANLRLAAESFPPSDGAMQLLNRYVRNVAKTTLIITPLLSIPNRVEFAESRIQDWLRDNTLWQSWIPSMYGVRTFESHGVRDRADVEIHRNGGLVACHYTQIDDESRPGSIAYEAELTELEERITIAAKFYRSINYHGPLIVSFQILCPDGYALFLNRPNGRSIPLEPSGTDIKFQFEYPSSELISNTKSLLTSVADRLYQAFGIWKSDPMR